MSERYGNGWAYARPKIVPLPPREVTDDELAEIPASRLLREPPRRDWMVDNLFVRGTVGMLSGAGSIGKSLLCQQLATCAVLGLPWLGMTLKRGKALFMGCEDDGDEMHRRQRDINAAYGCSMEDVCEAGLELIPRIDKDNVLMRLDKAEWRMRPTRLMVSLIRRCREHGIQYLFEDTASDTFDGNQNDERHVRDFVTENRKIAVMMGGIVIFTKHPSQVGLNDGSGESGSRQWNNKVRSRLYLHSEKDGSLVLEHVKSNYSAKGVKIPLKWKNGVFIVDTPEPPRRYGDL